jgi:hypothetical protein
VKFDLGFSLPDIAEMASFDRQRSQRKRTARRVFSPSDAGQYAVVYYDENDKYDIVKYSDVSSEKDGEVELKNGEHATILLVGEFFFCH